MKERKRLGRKKERNQKKEIRKKERDNKGKGN
jgi:hypothetical protein